MTRIRIQDLTVMYEFNLSGYDYNLPSLGFKCSLRYVNNIELLIPLKKKKIDLLIF